jgi:hypothetical protein
MLSRPVLVFNVSSFLAHLKSYDACLFYGTIAATSLEYKLSLLLESIAVTT